MEGNSETELLGLFGEIKDTRNNAGGRNGDAAGAEVESPGGVEDAEGGNEVFVVCHGFAHAHDDDVVEGGDLFGGTLGGGVFLATDVDELGDYFAGGEVAFPTSQAGSAEFGSRRRSRLGLRYRWFLRDFSWPTPIWGARMTTVSMSDLSPMRRRSFSVSSLEPLESSRCAGAMSKFLASLSRRDLGRLDISSPGGGTFLVKPLEDLFRSELGLADLREMGLERFEGLSVDRWLFGNEFHGRMGQWNPFSGFGN